MPTAIRKKMMAAVEMVVTALLPSHAGRQPRLLRQPEIPMRFNIDRAFRTEWMRRDMGYERALVLTRLMVLAPGGRGL